MYETITLHCDSDKFEVSVFMEKGEPKSASLYSSGTGGFTYDNPSWIKENLLPALRDFLETRDPRFMEVIWEDDKFPKDAESLLEIYELLFLADYKGWFEEQL